MNRNTLIAALAIFAASSAFAESPLAGGSHSPFVGAKSRAEVQAELQQYQASGVNPWAKSYDQLRGMHGSQTRAQVTAEFLQSRDEAAAMTAEDSGSAYLSARERSVAAPVLAGQPANAQ